MRIKHITYVCLHCGKGHRRRSAPRRNDYVFCTLGCYRAHERAASSAAVVERFWSHVDKDGPVPAHKPELGQCWVYRGDAQKAGSYGRVLLNGEHIYAHRFSYELHFGPLPEGFLSCHRCDYRPCVRPEHLFAGTDADNIRDMWAKGRGVIGTRQRGERNHSAKLSEQAAREIRALAPRRGLATALARQYGVRQATIWSVWHRETWKHVG